MAAFGEPSGVERSEPAPTRRRATASMGRWVAESPIRCGEAAATWWRRSSVSARCDPRLFPATAWISSTMIVSTPASIRRERSAVSNRYRDSGVVTRKVGGRLSMAARSEDAVSPVRTATVMGGASNPSSVATSAISRSGASRFWWMSTARALRGET